MSHLLDADFLALEDLNLSIELADLSLHDRLLLDDLLLVPGESLNLFLQLHHGGLVLGAQSVDLLLRLVVNVLQQLPQLGHLGLALPVDLQLALRAGLGLCESLRQGDDLHLQLLLLVLDPPPETHLGLQVLLEHTDLLLVPPHGSCNSIPAIVSSPDRVFSPDSDMADPVTWVSVWVVTLPSLSVL